MSMKCLERNIAFKTASFICKPTHHSEVYTMRGPKLGKLHYECPRCGDRYECVTDDDAFLASTHRLLHLAGEWKQSLRPAAYWTFEERELTQQEASNAQAP
jgi:hypothetical protein